MQVLQFLGSPFITGTNTINKIVNLFTMTIPRVLIKFYRYLSSKWNRNKVPPYVDPWWIKGNFRVFQFNYFPFEAIKRRFLIFQINLHFKILWNQDKAF